MRSSTSGSCADLLLVLRRMWRLAAGACMVSAATVAYQLLESDRRAIWLLEPELILNIALIILSRKSFYTGCSIFITDGPRLSDICAFSQLLHSSSMGEQRNALLLDSAVWLIIFVLCSLLSLLKLLSLQHLPASNTELLLHSLATWGK